VLAAAVATALAVSADLAAMTAGLPLADAADLSLPPAGTV
jgi:hypothetical protein